jgi:hypothetical protein
MDLSPRALEPFRRNDGIGMYFMPRRVWSGWPMLIASIVFCAGMASLFAGLILASVR